MTTCSSRYSEVVLSNYLYVPRRELRNYELAKRLLTAERKYEGDPIVMYDDSRTDWFGVPLYHYRSIESIAEKVTDRRTKGVKTEYEFKSSFWAGQEKVFEKFYRVGKNKDMAPGTGLGLSLAKHIVEDVHGGRLTVESVLGAGSTFAVTLPNAGQMT